MSDFSSLFGAALGSKNDDSDADDAKKTAATNAARTDLNRYITQDDPNAGLADAMSATRAMNATTQQQQPFPKINDMTGIAPVTAADEDGDDVTSGIASNQQSRNSRMIR